VQVEQLLASSAARVAAWATAAQRGGAGRGPARGGKRRARALEGTWRREEWRGGSWGSGNRPARAAGAAQRETERGGLEVDEGGPSCNFSKVQRLHCKARLTFKP
jgi:hypothetical protein